ncbi:hypothetical protein VP01_383g1 [Puccinia sorghi]|uniref:Uncharacterized protein n=1 Tax=Puccinia sorghi TaxID=27349 RepID=A0A0L6UTA5_9BASI|nr:hypothetical protein VP01_383g1 [Puccinia sorghi]
MFKPHEMKGFTKDLLNCLQLTCRKFHKASVVTPTVIQPSCDAQWQLGWSMLHVNCRHLRDSKPCPKGFNFIQKKRVYHCLLRSKVTKRLFKKLMWVSNMTKSATVSLTGFQQSTISKPSFFFTNNLLDPIMEKLITITSFLIVDLLYLIHPIVLFYSLTVLCSWLFSSFPVDDMILQLQRINYKFAYDLMQLHALFSAIIGNIAQLPIITLPATVFQLLFFKVTFSAQERLLCLASLSQSILVLAANCCDPVTPSGTCQGCPNWGLRTFVHPPVSNLLSKALIITDRNVIEVVAKPSFVPLLGFYLFVVVYWLSLCSQHSQFESIGEVFNVCYENEDMDKCGGPWRNYLVFTHFGILKSSYQAQQFSSKMTNLHQRRVPMFWVLNLMPNCLILSLALPAAGPTKLRSFRLTIPNPLTHFVVATLERRLFPFHACMKLSSAHETEESATTCPTGMDAVFSLQTPPQSQSVLQTFPSYCLHCAIYGPRKIPIFFLQRAHPDDLQERICQPYKTLTILLTLHVMKKEPSFFLCCPHKLFLMWSLQGYHPQCNPGIGTNIGSLSKDYLLTILSSSLKTDLHYQLGAPISSPLDLEPDHIMKTVKKISEVVGELNGKEEEACIPRAWSTKGLQSQFFPSSTKPHSGVFFFLSCLSSCCPMHRIVFSKVRPLFKRKRCQRSSVGVLSGCTHWWGQDDDAGDGERSWTASANRKRPSSPREPLQDHRCTQELARMKLALQIAHHGHFQRHPPLLPIQRQLSHWGQRPLYPWRVGCKGHTPPNTHHHLSCCPFSLSFKNLKVKSLERPSPTLLKRKKNDHTLVLLLPLMFVVICCIMRPICAQETTDLSSLSPKVLLNFPRPPSPSCFGSHGPSLTACIPHVACSMPHSFFDSQSLSRFHNPCCFFGHLRVKEKDGAGEMGLGQESDALTEAGHNQDAVSPTHFDMIEFREDENEKGGKPGGRKTMLHMDLKQRNSKDKPKKNPKKGEANWKPICIHPCSDGRKMFCGLNFDLFSFPLTNTHSGYWRRVHVFILSWEPAFSSKLCLSYINGQKYVGKAGVQQTQVVVPNTTKHLISAYLQGFWQIILYFAVGLLILGVFLKVFWCFGWFTKIYEYFQVKFFLASYHVNHSLNEFQFIWNFIAGSLKIKKGSFVIFMAVTTQFLQMFPIFNSCNKWQDLRVVYLVVQIPCCEFDTYLPHPLSSASFLCVINFHLGKQKKTGEYLMEVLSVLRDFPRSGSGSEDCFGTALIIYGIMNEWMVKQQLPLLMWLVIIAFWLFIIIIFHQAATKKQTKKIKKEISCASTDYHLNNIYQLQCKPRPPLVTHRSENEIHQTAEETKRQLQSIVFIFKISLFVLDVLYHSQIGFVFLFILSFIWCIRSPQQVVQVPECIFDGNFYFHFIRRFLMIGVKLAKNAVLSKIWKNQNFGNDITHLQSSPNRSQDEDLPEEGGTKGLQGMVFIHYSKKQIDTRILPGEGSLGDGADSAVPSNAEASAYLAPQFGRCIIASFLIYGVKYTIRNQLIIQKLNSSLMGLKSQLHNGGFTFGLSVSPPPPKNKDLLMQANHQLQRLPCHCVCPGSLRCELSSNKKLRSDKKKKNVGKNKIKNKNQGGNSLHQIHFLGRNLCSEILPQRNICGKILPQRNLGQNSATKESSPVRFYHGGISDLQQSFAGEDSSAAKLCCRKILCSKTSISLVFITCDEMIFIDNESYFIGWGYPTKSILGRRATKYHFHWKVLTKEMNLALLSSNDIFPLVGWGPKMTLGVSAASLNWEPTPGSNPASSPRYGEWIGLGSCTGRSSPDPPPLLNLLVATEVLLVLVQNLLHDFREACHLGKGRVGSAIFSASLELCQLGANLCCTPSIAALSLEDMTLRSRCFYLSLGSASYKNQAQCQGDGCFLACGPIEISLQLCNWSTDKFFVLALLLLTLENRRFLTEIKKEFRQKKNRQFRISKPLIQQQRRGYTLVVVTLKKNETCAVEFCFMKETVKKETAVAKIQFKATGKRLSLYDVRHSLGPYG